MATMAVTDCKKVNGVGYNWSTHKTEVTSSLLLHPLTMTMSHTGTAVRSVQEQNGHCLSLKMKDIKGEKIIICSSSKLSMRTMTIKTKMRRSNNFLPLRNSSNPLKISSQNESWKECQGQIQYKNKEESK